MDDRTLGDRIKTIREHRELTQEQLAGFVGYHTSTVCKYEAGKRSLRATDLVVFSEALNVEIGAFFAEGDDFSEF